MIEIKIPGREPADLMGLRKALEADGIPVVAVECVRNHQGKGPLVVVRVEGDPEAPGPVTAAVNAGVARYLRDEKTPSLARPLRLTSPDGTRWLLSVDDAGALSVRKEQG
jgi:hypothetical protein